MKRALLGLALVAALVPQAAGAQTAPCQFVLGFQALHDADPTDVGDCTDNQAFAANGDAMQHTTNGLMVWRKADNWTAFTNGYQTWINGPDGLVSRLNTERFPWEASAADVPASTTPTPTPSAMQTPTPGPSPSATPTPTGPPATIPSCAYTTDTSSKNLVISVCEGDSTFVMTVPVPSGGSLFYSFPYQARRIVGGVSIVAAPSVTFTVKVSGLEPYNRSNVGVRIWDGQTIGKAPRMTWTLQANPTKWDPATLQESYSSSSSGPVTVELFNYTARTQTFSVSFGGLTYPPTANHDPTYVPLVLTKQ
ncbi:MAG TPA: hypothetical protein VK009_20475 [Chloroflexota bacterium]|nr:hypothetical protein [Chloroflexota bacterium]